MIVLSQPDALVVHRLAIGVLIGSIFLAGGAVLDSIRLYDADKRRAAVARLYGADSKEQ